MPVYSSFKQGSTDDVTTFVLKKGARKNLNQFLINNGLECYLTNDQLEDIKQISDKKKQQQEIMDIYLPQKGSTKSGDFGEILSFFFIIQEKNDDNVTIMAPKKWIWKEDKDRPTPHSDAILFVQENPNVASPEDIVVTIESKMAATKPQKEKNRVKDAIEGALDDNVTRMAKTICWLYSRYGKDRDTKNKQYINRFRTPVDNPYKKECYAIAIIDSDFFEDQVSNAEGCNEVKVYAMSIPKLKLMYEKFFKEISNV